MQLTPNFSLKELTYSETAAKRGINNSATPFEILKLRALCWAILEPVRANFGKQVTVRSGKRALAVNRIIGSSDSSQHVQCEAVDFEVIGISNAEVAKWIAKNLLFDQLILEGHHAGDPNSGWIHCSLNMDGKNRRQVLEIKNPR